MINLEEIILNVLNETNVVGTALGSPASGTSQFSGDFYATGDNRIPHSLFGGKIFRRNINKSKGKKRKKRKKK